jgi:hypothetical protein
VILRATRGSGDTWAFSEQSDPSNYVTLNTSGSSSSTTVSLNRKTFNFLVTINWVWGDSAETVPVQAYVVDSVNVSDTHTYSNAFGVEAHLASAKTTQTSPFMGLTQGGRQSEFLLIFIGIVVAVLFVTFMLVLACRNDRTERRRRW